MTSQTENTANPAALIRSVYDDLSRTQQKIADLLLERGDAVCFLSLADFSALAGVTAVTVVNFAKKLGYESFSDLKKDFQSYIQSMLSPRNVVRADIAGCVGQDGSDMLSRAMDNEQELLRETFRLISRESLFEAVRLLLGARRVYLAARGLAIPVAESLLARLTFLRIDAESLRLDNLNLLPRRLADAGEQDVFVVFSFPNYNKSIGQVARSARHLGSKVICVTDKTASPPSCYSDVILLCQTSSLVFYNSMTAPHSLVNILATLMAVELREKLEGDRDKLQKLAAFFTDNS